MAACPCANRPNCASTQAVVCGRALAIQGPAQLPDPLAGVEPVDDLGGVREVLGRQLPDPLRPVAEDGDLAGPFQPAPMRLQGQPWPEARPLAPARPRSWPPPAARRSAVLRTGTTTPTLTSRPAPSVPRMRTPSMATYSRSGGAPAAGGSPCAQAAAISAARSCSRRAPTASVTVRTVLADSCTRAAAAKRLARPRQTAAAPRSGRPSGAPRD